MIFDGETILEDDYPVFWDYLYVCDGKVRRSDVRGTVADLKRDVGATEVRRCNIMARQKAAAEHKQTEPQLDSPKPTAPNRPLTRKERRAMQFGKRGDT